MVAQLANVLKAAGSNTSVSDVTARYVRLKLVEHRTLDKFAQKPGPSLCRSSFVTCAAGKASTGPRTQAQALRHTLTHTGTRPHVTHSRGVPSRESWLLIDVVPGRWPGPMHVSDPGG